MIRQVMLPASPDPCNGPSPPFIRRTVLGDANTTVMCETPPPFASFSQKQPPGRASIDKFAALPE